MNKYKIDLPRFNKELEYAVFTVLFSIIGILMIIAGVSELLLSPIIFRAPPTKLIVVILFGSLLVIFVGPAAIEYFKKYRRYKKLQKAFNTIGLSTLGDVAIATRIRMEIIREDLIYLGGQGYLIVLDSNGYPSRYVNPLVENQLKELNLASLKISFPKHPIEFPLALIDLYFLIGGIYNLLSGVRFNHFPSILLGVLMILLGRKCFSYFATYKRYREYKNVFLLYKFSTIEKLAMATGNSPYQVEDDIKKMILRGYFQVVNNNSQNNNQGKNTQDSVQPVSSAFKQTGSEASNIVNTVQDVEPVVSENSTVAAQVTDPLVTDSTTGVFQNIDQVVSVNAFEIVQTANPAVSVNAPETDQITGSVVDKNISDFNISNSEKTAPSQTDSRHSAEMTSPEILRLDNLRSQGILTEEEFQTLRDKLLKK